MTALLPLLLLAIPANDGRIVYVGRFTDDRACQWSASEVRLRVKGPSLAATIEEKGHDGWQVVIDGKPSTVLAPKEGTETVNISLGGDAEHEVRLVKRTEPSVGTARFVAFDTPGGKLLRASPKRRHLEVIGDSITCAYGNEGANQDERFRPETENAYMGYASIAARMLDADVTTIAWSGRKMWPNFTIPEIYDRILPTQPTPVWQFRGPKPEAVVINLATNDFGQNNPEEKGWTGAYEAFIRRIWSHYPKAHVYAAIGSMMSDNWPPDHRALSTLRGYLQRMSKRIDDPRLHIIEFPTQAMEDGIGSDWHPNVRTHEKMGRQLAEALRRDVYRR